MSVNKIKNIIPYFSASLCLLLLFCWTDCVLARVVIVKDIQIFSDQPETRVVLTFNAPFTYNAFVLRYPNRLVVDFPDGKLADKWDGLALIQVTHNTVVKAIRSGFRRKKKLRMVFDLKEPLTLRTSQQLSEKGLQSQLILKLAKLSKTNKTNVAQSIKQVTKVSVPRKNHLRNIIIVIDPGHGGKDPGATGPRGVKEKIVVLAIAKRLQKLINQQSGLQAILTRKSDYYVGLRERLDLARQANADIFIAIHADAYKFSNSTGASVFALSQRGASSEAARWLAEQENYSELGEASLKGRSYLVRSVLIDLTQTVTINFSLQLGIEVLRQLNKMAKLHSEKIEQAPFVVLKSPDIPSILIETGFISNPKEALKLSDPHYQNQLAGSVLQGIKMYFREHAPRNSWLHANRHTKYHKVVRGDSLSKIALRYRVSVKQLKQLNRLRNNKLNVGQQLLLPRREAV